VEKRQKIESETAERLVEVARECDRGAFDVSVRAIPFGLADLDQPAVLQKSEHHQQHGQSRGESERREAAQFRRKRPGHETSINTRLMCSDRRPRPIYISYQVIAGA
jgi:hypothetical protein